VGGERLHALARRGIEVTRAPRRVHVSSWEWLDIRIPEATFRVRCSSGTYVRTLVHDLGQALGCGAALGALRRLASEPFTIEQAITVAELDTLTAEQALARAGIPLERALAALPAVALDPAAAAARGAGGRPHVAPEGAPIGAGPRSVVFRDEAGQVLALGELAADPGEPGRALACPRVVFPWAVRSGR
jgi:tRNA pseudouridine55 synthase